MKTILAMIAAGIAAGVMFASHAKLPPAPAKTDEQKKAEADKAAATKAKEAEDLGKAVDRAVANARKNGKAGPAAMDGKK
jgi:hypothetical protein